MMSTKPLNLKAAIGARKFLRKLEKDLTAKTNNPSGNNLDTDIQLKRLEYLKIINFDVDEGLAEFGQYLSPKRMAKLINEQEKIHSKKSASTLRNQLAKVEVDLMIEKGYASINQRLISYLENYIEGVEYARGANSRKRQAAVLSNKDKDNARRHECLKIALKGVTTITGYEYHKYFNELKRSYPKPLHVPNPRLTAAEKKLSKAKQKKIIEEKAAERDGNWLDQSERAFFKKATGKTARSKKSS